MSKTTCKYGFLPFLICLVLALVFLITVPVSADDGQPVDPPAVEEVTAPPQTDAPPPVVEPAQVEGLTPPVDEPAPPTDPAPVEEPTQVDAPPVQEPAPPVEEPAPVEEPTVQEITTAVADAGLVLVDSTGSASPMATRDTSLGVVEGDPYFNVGSIRYKFMKIGGCLGLDNCFESPTPIQAALDYMASHNLTPTDRKLYIESVDDLDEDYNEDVSVYGFLPGVNGLLSLVGVGDTPEKVKLLGSISVFGMPAGFSINNLTVYNDSPLSDQAAIYFGGNKGLIQLVDVNATSAGTDGIGIVVTGQTGNVELNRVAANHNGYHGALINVTSGTIKITNSEFNHNQQHFDDGWSEFDDYGGTDLEPMSTGLRVSSTNGAVTLYGVEVNDNLGGGATIIAPTSTVSIKNSVFNNNGTIYGHDGLFVEGNIVSLDHLVANENADNGISSVVNSSFTGLNLSLDNNGVTGLDVNGCSDVDTDSYCDNIGPGIVTIKYSTSQNHGSSGFDVYAKGAITFVDTWSGMNGGPGYQINNQDATAPAAVVVTNSDSYQNDYGFEIESRGAVTMTDFSAVENSTTGVLILASGTGAITLTNVGTGFNEIRENGGDGYQIVAMGPVTIINTNTSDNANLGGFIDNSSAASAVPVTIKVLVPATTSSNYENNDTGGLQIFSRGVVTISNIRVIDNRGSGAVINNSPPGTSPGVAVTISDSSFFYNTDYNSLTEESGLIVISKGMITLLNVVAFDNDGYGAYLNNQVAGTTAGITINAGTGKGNSFISNRDDGLIIRSNGAVTLTNINATGNGDYGVNIDNTTGTGGVTIKAAGTWGTGFDYSNIWSWGNSFSRSGYDGLYITSHGPVSVTVHQARENPDEGIRIIGLGGTGAVTITGPTGSLAQIYDNGTVFLEDGIHVEANGLITLNKIDTRDNFAAGAYLVNDTGTGGVTLTEFYAENNYDGLLISTKGAVVWKTGSAIDNFSYGANISNASSILPYKSVTISNVLATSNGETGISVDSRGAVTLTNVESNNNSADEYVIEYGDQWTDNLGEDQSWYFYGTPGERVNIEVSSPNFNPWAYVTDPEGNFVSSANGIDGSLTLTFDIELADLEGDYMIHLGTDNGEILWGYQISLFEGTIEPIFTQIESIANGIAVNNFNGINAPVTITNTYHPWISNNSGTNVVVMSSGLVTLTNMELNDSVQEGLRVDNSTPTSTAPSVILTNVNFHNNDQNGATIITDGMVTVKNSNLSGNGEYGFYIVNNLSPTNTAGVSMTGVQTDTSGNDGIAIFSRGPVSLTSVWSNENILDGIDIYTNGAVTFNNVGAWGNGGVGADVTALISFTAIQPVNSWNDFSGNTLDGLYVFSNGKITLAKVRANDNGLRLGDGTPVTYAFGIFLDNSGNAVGTGLVTLTNLETIGNTLEGISVYTKSGITATTIVSRYNTLTGISMIQIIGPIIVPGLTLSDITVEGNGVDGLKVDALGNIVVNKVVAIGNGTHGMNLINSSGNGSVTMLNSKGNNFALYNGGRGVVIASKGAVSVTGLEVVGNSNSGIVINNDTALIPVAITLNSVYARSNNNFGIWLTSKGVVTVNNSCSIGNVYSGFDIWTPNNVFVNNSSALNNGWAGIYIELNPGGTGNLGFTAKLTNSTWYGNLKNPPVGNTNLMVIDGNKVIL